MQEMELVGHKTHEVTLSKKRPLLHRYVHSTKTMYTMLPKSAMQCISQILPV